MKRKRILPVILIVILASLPVACSSKKAQQDSTTNNEKLASSNNEFIKSLVSLLGDSSKKYGDTFGQGSITEIKIDIDEDSWNELLKDAKAEQYYSADISINGTSYKNIGMRTKGNSTLTSVADSDSNRYGFRIKADKYVKGQTFQGLDDFVLNANFADPSYMREYLTYAAMAKLGGITPFVNFTNLYINGELYGFYLCVEAYDDSFVERISSDKNAALYKAERENCTLTTSDDASGFEQKYGDEDNNKRIKEFIKVLNSTTQENKEKLEEVFDVSSALKAWTVNTVMGNYDSYSGSKAHNYYLLYDNKKLSYVGWDYNMSMGGFTEDNGASVTVKVSSPMYNANSEERPLITKLLAVDSYNKEYLGYVNTLIDWLNDFEKNVADLGSIIHDYVANDPTAFYTVDKFEANIVESDSDLTKVQAQAAPAGNQQGQPQGTPPAGGPGENEGQMPQGTPPAGGPGGDSGQQPQGTPPADGPGGDQGGKPQGTPPAGGPGGDGGQMPNGGGGMISNNAVSIVDYIQQRIEQIKAQ